MSKFKVDDKVFCNKFKLSGKVTSVSHYLSNYSIVVEFDNGQIKTYTIDGRHHINEEPQLIVTHTNTKFTVGCKVKSLYNSGGYVTDKVYTVTAIDESYYQSDRNEVRLDTVDEDGYRNGWGSSNFELYTTIEVVTDEELLKQATDGRKAVIALYKKHGDNFQSRYPESKNSKLKYNWMSAGGMPSPIEYRIKPKPVFEQYNASGWKVYLDQDKNLVYIGCTAFTVEFLQNAFKRLLKNDASYEDSKTKFFAVRGGVMYKEHLLNWTEVEKLNNLIKDL